MKTIFKVPVEVYSRVVGYFRPINQWNYGQKKQFKDRKTIKLDEENFKKEVEN